MCEMVRHLKWAALEVEDETLGACKAKNKRSQELLLLPGDFWAALGS